MNRRLVPGLAVAAGLAGVACSDQPQEQNFAGPSLAVNTTNVCAPNVFNSLIAGYFTSPQQQTAKNYKDAMIDALTAAATTHDSTPARKQGFNVLREIALAAKGVPQPPAATGSELTVEVLKCIFDVTDTNVIKPLPVAGTFTNSLSHTAGGVYEIRGLLAIPPDPGDPNGPVQAVTGNPAVVIAGIAPPPPQTSTWWDGILDGQRVLLYGEPGSTTGSYELSAVPRNASFDPPAVVTTCVNDVVEGVVDPSLMLTETNVGILAFTEAGYIGCGLPPTALRAPAGPFDLLRHLASLGRDLIVPDPLAATVVSPGLVGGAASKTKSLFNTDQVDDLTVTTSTVPPRIKVSTGRFSLTITVTEDGLFGNGMRAVLGTTTNNGTGTDVRVAPPGVACSTGSLPQGITGTGSNPTGVVTISNLCFTKTGKVKVTVTVNAVNRSGNGFAITNSSNVIP